MIFGEYKYMTIGLDDLITLPQVRQTKNNKLQELMDSIEDKGLINPLDIAIMDKTSFCNHIEFINNLWQTNIDYRTFPCINDHYYVIISGHTRLEALKMLAQKNNEKYQVSVKIHPIKTSEEILSYQLDENIHSEPRIEERAIAIIEYYQLGLTKKLWTNKSEFITQNQNKFSRHILYDALSFSDLPLNVQQFIFSGNIYYAVGVELGKMHNLIVKYVKHLLEDNFNDKDLNDAIKYEYAIILGKLQKNKSVKSSLSFLSGYRKMMENVFQNQEEVQQEMLNWFNDGVNRQAEEAKKALEKEHKKVIQELINNKFESSRLFLDLDTKLTGKDNREKKKILEHLANLNNKN